MLNAADRYQDLAHWFDSRYYRYSEDSRDFSDSCWSTSGSPKDE